MGRKHASSLEASSASRQSEIVSIPANSMLTPGGGEDGIGLGHRSEQSKRSSTGPQRDSTRSHVSFITAFR